MIKRILAGSILTTFLAAAALPVLAQSVSPSASPSVSPSVSPSASPKPEKKKVNLACMQAATDKRDTAIIAAVDTYYASVKSALETRKAALKAAWGLTDPKARREALRAAWNTFKGTWRKAARALKAARGAAWKQFYTDRKACGTSGTSEDPGTEAVDAQL